jgi:hypothetical protein
MLHLNEDQNEKHGARGGRCVLRVAAQSEFLGDMAVKERGVIGGTPREIVKSGGGWKRAAAACRY